jgi:LCP family protein required for cell wall assembly
LLGLQGPGPGESSRTCGLLCGRPGDEGGLPPVACLGCAALRGTCRDVWQDSARLSRSYSTRWTARSDWQHTVTETLGGKRLVYRGIAPEWWWLIWAAAGICVFLFGAALGVMSSGGGEGAGWFGEFLTPVFGSRSQITILAVGVDDSQGRGLADTIIVAAIRPRTGEISALAIPRDSRVEIPGLGVRRINSAHSFGDLPLTLETVELLLGTPIDHYIEVNVSDLIKLVDAIGGVDIDVEKRMYYRDRSQDLLIDLQPGRQRLNGMQAMGYVRYRHDAMGDLGRIQRQRQFLRAVVRQLLVPDNITSIPRLVQVFVDTVRTDLTARELLLLKKLLEQVGADAIRMDTLPGEPCIIEGQSVLEIDPEAAQRTVDRVLWGQGVSVRVLNGTDVSGLAARTASLLEGYGCEVADTGNASQKADTTLIIDHRGSARRAERVAAWLGGGAISVAPGDDDSTDVTVVLGRDMADRLR